VKETVTSPSVAVGASISDEQEVASIANAANAKPRKVFFIVIYEFI
jgi:hypothetical protein